MEIVDAHTHIGYSPFIHPPYLRTVDDLLAAMDLNGVKGAIVFPMVGADRHFTKLEYSGYNTMVAEAMKRFPKRIVGFARINPHLHEVALEELDRAINKLGLRGVKLHPALQEFKPNNDIVHPILSWAAKRRLPVIFHSGTAPYSLPKLFNEVAEMYPELTIILGHSGLEHWPEALEVMRGHGNIVLETSGLPLKGLREVVKEDASRVLFGSDWPYFEVQSCIKMVREIGLKPEIEALLLGENCLRILKLSFG